MRTANAVCRMPCAGSRDTCQPIGYPQGVESRRGQDMAQVRARCAEVATAPQAQHPDALRDGPLDACSARILGGILRRLFALALRLEGEEGVLGPDRDGAALVALARPDTLAAARAGLAILERELGLAHGGVAVVERRGPADTGMPFEADRPLLLPVDREALSVEALPCARLPLDIRARRAQ
jgi:hypothetical protein